MKLPSSGYLLIRAVPDVGRGEFFNVGMVAWADGELFLELSDEAIQRAAKVARDGLKDWKAIDIETHLKSVFQDGQRFLENLELAVSRQRGYPISYSEPRRMSLRPKTPTARVFDEVVRRLFDELVTPPVKTVIGTNKSPGAPTPIQRLDQLLGSLNDTDKLKRSHALLGPTGVEFRVNYFISSRFNVALDVIDPNQAVDEVRKEGFAEAYKVDQVIKSRSNIAEFYVLCDASRIADRRSAVNLARNIAIEDVQKALSGVGAKVLTETVVAAKVIKEAAMAV